MAKRQWRSLGHALARFCWPLAGLAALAVVLACVLVVPRWLVRSELGAEVRTLTATERAKATNDVRATLLQSIGGAVLLLGVYFTYRQLTVAQQGQVTERFTHAIDQLGHAELDVRLGGIYALERIANDSPDDRATIAEVLTAFVRGHAPWPPSVPGQYVADAPIEQVPELQVRAPDVQAALRVLARRQAPPKPSGRLDLHATDLRRADLAGVAGFFPKFQKVDLSSSNLEKARLVGTFLNGAYLKRARLTGADLTVARLQRADLVGANLQEAVLAQAQLKGAVVDATTCWPADFDPSHEGVVRILRPGETGALHSPQQVLEVRDDLK